eukprot:TRINITY_DN1665_c0_g1_i2.p1 TRINITY_DN1665_c0_g1~~TRINITY_DN1665_c0_g1_i2.p1  ORF type:complete len:1209 (-),score=393.82 TRINITY_DN1665_c0_g1_i2:29-3655(-)
MDLREDEVEAPPPPMAGPPPPIGGPPTSRGRNQGGANAQGSLSDEIQGSGVSTWRSKTFPNKSTTGLTGLCNQGATCYLNSLLQTLFMTPELRLALYRWNYNPTIDGPERTCIPLQLQRLFSRLQFSHCPYLETTNLTTSFNWVGSEVYEQHDVQELCRVLFEAIDKTFLMNAIPNSIFPLYSGSLHDYLRCTECNNSSVREDSFMDLQLVIRGFKNLRSALIGYITPEILEGNNKWFCDKCQKKVVALKGLRIYKLPKLLTLQLKRFEFDWKTESRKKVNDRLRFPFYLDLSDIVLKDISLEQAKSNQKKQQEQNTEESAATGGAGNDSGKSSSSSAQWSCALCTYINDPTYVMCEMCFTPRPQESIQKPAVPIPEPTSTAVAVEESKSTEHKQDEAKKEEQEEEEEEEDKDEERPVITEENSGRVYELYSVLVHSGSAMGGHYYVYIKSLTSDQWYNFNDQTVTFLTQRQVRETFGEQKTTSKQNNTQNGDNTLPESTPVKARVSKWATSANAYVLMYRRMDLNREVEFKEEAKTEEGVTEGMLRLGQEDIPKELKKEIEDENKEYVEEKVKWEVRINTLSLKIYFDNPYENNRRDTVVISILKNSSVLELLVAAHQTINQYLHQFYINTTNKEENKEDKEENKEKKKEEEELRIEDLRLRHYNTKTGNCGAVIVSKQQIENIGTENNLKTLEQLSIYQDKTLFCEFKNQNESNWKSGDLNEVGLTLSVLKLSKPDQNQPNDSSSMQETWGKIKFEGENFVNKNIREITTKDLQHQINEVFSIPAERQTIARIHGAEIDFFCLGSSASSASLSLVEDLGLSDGAVVYVEDLIDPQLALVQNTFPAPSLIRQKFEVEKNLITLKLFSPLFSNENNDNNSSSGRVGIDVVSDLLEKQSAVASSGIGIGGIGRKENKEEKLGTIEMLVDQRMKLGQLRLKICEWIGKDSSTGEWIVGPNEIEIHKKLLRGEYKNDDATLSDLALYEDSNLLILKGTPSLLHQFKCKLFLSNTRLPTSHNSSLSLLHDKFAVNQNWTIGEFKKQVCKIVGVSSDVYKTIRIRIKKKGGGFGEVLKGKDDKTLTSAMEEPLLDEMEWIINVLEEEEEIDEEELIIEVRRWGRIEEEGKEKKVGKWWRVGDLRREVGGEKIKKGMRSLLGLDGDEEEGWDVGDDEVVSGRPLYLKDGVCNACSEATQTVETSTFPNFFERYE